MRSLGKPVKPQGASRPKRRFGARLFQAYLVSAVFGLAALMLVARRKPYFAADVKISRGMQQLDAAWFHRLMRGISLPGYPPQAMLLSGFLPVALYRMGLKWEAVVEALTSAGIGLVSLLLRSLVDRPRPKPGLVRVKGTLDGGRLSFPAGHVQAYVPVLGFLSFISFTVIRRSWQRTLALGTTLALVLLIGPSRIDTGEHWASDVLGGYLLGTVWLWLTVKFYCWGKPRFFVWQPLTCEAQSRPGSQLHAQPVILATQSGGSYGKC